MSAPKLTKKQKKGLAFRERKNQKSNGISQEELAFPETDLLVGEEEQPDESELNTHTQSHQINLETKKKDENSTNLGKRKRGDEAKLDREAEETVTKQPTKKKKRQKVKDENDDESMSEKGTDKKSDSKDTSKSRFILFVGNLKYTTSIDAIQEHFSKCDPPPKIRLLTPKPKTPGATSKSKGCAFLEFSHRNALQQGLKLHASTLDGRRINVELTAGGGGKSENRVKKVQARNKQLLEQRKEVIRKKADAGEDVDTIVVAPPQRHSTTSGLDHVPKAKRTWSVPQGDETTERGGTKKRGKKIKSSRSWGTGANAITVG
ncbi:hypothetical protein Clacol_004023 [Clathrus columnatus]|uniref:RRM domain-containing protein n=1 Tax=Clathrus columnatus TaxID=1419009 RepID=A0AAV5A9A6_9AGAM|nr:hypothetical protein Clacol_004023 [Clathrus columnatus]